MKVLFRVTHSFWIISRKLRECYDTIDSAQLVFVTVIYYCLSFTGHFTCDAPFATLPFSKGTLIGIYLTYLHLHPLRSMFSNFDCNFEFVLSLEISFSVLMYLHGRFYTFYLVFVFSKRRIKRENAIEIFVISKIKLSCGIVLKKVRNTFCVEIASFVIYKKQRFFCICI